MIVEVIVECLRMLRLKMTKGEESEGDRRREDGDVKGAQRATPARKKMSKLIFSHSTIRAIKIVENLINVVTVMRELSPWVNKITI